MIDDLIREITKDRRVDSVEKRVRASDLTEAEYTRLVRLVHRVESTVAREPRCLALDLSCSVRTTSSWCHLHRNEEDASESLSQLRGRIQGLRLDRPSVASAAFVRQVGLEYRLERALKDAREEFGARPVEREAVAA